MPRTDISKYGFKPGQSGNPSGKPKGAKGFNEKCRKFMTEEGGFDKLVAIASGRGRSEDQLKALMFIAEHGFGKAVQQVAGAEDEFFPPVKIITGVVAKAQLEVHQVTEYNDPRLDDSEAAQKLMTQVIPQLPASGNEDADWDGEEEEETEGEYAEVQQ